MPTARPPIDRFMGLVEWSDERHEGTRCLRWTGVLNKGGYGRIFVDGRKRVAHRWIYEHWFGPIPDGLVTDHLCRRPWCVNAGHLEPVTQSENTRRGDTIPARNAAKTHCIHGHEFTPENTKFDRNKNRRFCRECLRQKYRARYRRRRDKARALRDRPDQVASLTCHCQGSGQHES